MLPVFADVVRRSRSPETEQATYWLSTASDLRQEEYRASVHIADAAEWLLKLDA